MEKIIIVKGKHIGGHKLMENLGGVKTDFVSKFSEEAIENLKYKAYKVGGNGVTSLTPYRKVMAKGNYITTLTGYEGNVVKVKKK